VFYLGDIHDKYITLLLKAQSDPTLVLQGAVMAVSCIPYTKVQKNFLAPNTIQNFFNRSLLRMIKRE